MALLGKWFQYEHDDVDAFADANAPDKAAIAPLVALLKLTGPTGYVEELSLVEGKNINRKVYINGVLKKDVTAPIGEEYDGQSWDGRPCKVFVSKDDSGLTRNETMPDGKKIVSKIVSSENEAVITITGNGVTCTRKFKRAQ